ncbi:hypothetical protein RISK_006023 [Rhodopirellula islandica]|uniref:Uncharacterized protein n=1 Tax=Rhodopirellula islandica TaxID=595434 RepID=A0A0J1E8P6_RHOIS|nr:hypothetical protein RISK_006023 [Rhodopirellula islandica]
MPADPLIACLQLRQRHKLVRFSIPFRVLRFFRGENALEKFCMISSPVPTHIERNVSSMAEETNASRRDDDAQENRHVQPAAFRPPQQRLLCKHRRGRAYW